MPDAPGQVAITTVERVSTRRSATLPGCSFGLGIGSSARDDSRSVLTVWLVTSLSWAILPIAVLSWFARRSLLGAAARLIDRAQGRAINAYLRQFDGCRFAPIRLDEVAPPPIADMVRRCAAALRGGGEPLIWYLESAEAGAIRPGAFTTFFSLRSPPLVICPRDPRTDTGYQRFILYHELGHVAGFQTSHSAGRLAAIADAVVIGGWFALLGTDHAWGWAVLAVYAALRVFEIARAPSSRSAETHADLWGLWGVEVEGGDVERMLHLHRLYLSKLDSAIANERLGYISDWRRDQFERIAERNAAMLRAVGPDGVLRVEVDHDVGADFSETFGRIDNIQLGGPGGLDRPRFASMIVTSLPLAILLGVALRSEDLAGSKILRLAVVLMLLATGARLIGRQISNVASRDGHPPSVDPDPRR